MNTLRKMWNERPLTLILWTAIILRLVAVIFAKGFGMHDDHFLVIEPAQSWVDGTDYNNWLPWSSGNTHPTGHSFFYVGIQFLILSLFKWIHLSDPQHIMFAIRLIHGAFSLLIVTFGYKIAEKIAGKNEAKLAGIILATAWFMPWLSVRNLVEIVCIPLLMWGVWVMLRSGESKKPLLQMFWAGFIIGLAFSVRFQTLFFTGGLGLALLIQKRWKATFAFGFGLLACIILLQGGIDWFIWHRPFAEFEEYVRYNLDNAYNYITSGWYTYFLLIAGILIPPMGLLLFFGFFRTWKKQLLIFLPTLIFLAFHSYFPNKQERFILPILPFIIVLGVVGWQEFVNGSGFWKKNQKLLRGFWIAFWSLNLILLPAITTMYSKKARVESMYYLSKYHNLECIMIEDSNREHAKMPPRFYLGQWIEVLELANGKNNHPIEKVLNGVPESNYPAFVLFFEDNKLDQRVDNVKRMLPALEYETTIEPGFVDKVLYWLNPINANQTIYIYRNSQLIPEKLS